MMNKPSSKISCFVIFNAFNEGTRLIHCLKMHKRLFGVETKEWEETTKGPYGADGNPVHLLRHSHGKRSTAGGQDRA